MNVLSEAKIDSNSTSRDHRRVKADRSITLESLLANNAQNTSEPCNPWLQTTMTDVERKVWQD